MEERSQLLRSGTESAKRGQFFEWTEVYLNSIRQTIYTTRTNDDDDAVSTSIKVFILLLIVTLSLWEMSYLAIMIEVIRHDHFTTKDWVLFIPMWLGSIIGLVGSVTVSWRLYTKAKLIPRERRLYMMSQGIIEDCSYIDYESLPLMRTLFCWSIVGASSFLMALIGQLLYFHWFNHPTTSLLEALLPIVLVFLIFIGYMFVVNIFSVKSCILFALVALQMIIFSLKIQGHFTQWGWIIATVPLFVFAAVMLWDLFALWIAHTFQRTIVLHQYQQMCWVFYISALLLMMIAGTYNAYYDIVGGGNPDISYTCWTVAVPFAILGGKIVLYREGANLASSRGFKPPMTLSRTSQGWEPLAHGNPVWTWLFGTIEPTQASLANLSTTSRSSIVNLGNGNDQFIVSTRSHNVPYQSTLKCEAVSGSEKSRRGGKTKKKRLSEIEMPPVNV